MNLLKSMFISNYMMMAMGIMGYAGWMLYQGANVVAWGGVLLTAAPIMMVISWLMMIKNVARTSSRFPFLSILAIIGAGMSIWAWSNQITDEMAPMFAVVGLFGFLIYANWYSTFGRQPSDKIKIGSSLPDFKLKNSNNKSVSMMQLTKKPAILIFFRGNWCPLCMAQVKEISKRYRELSELGVQVALISPQPHKNTIGLAKKFDVKFNFLTDKGNKVARALGIALPNGLPFGMQMMGYNSETVLPTVIITDQNGKVVWTHETDNYRVRPEPEMFFNVLRRSGIIPATVVQ